MLNVPAVGKGDEERGDEEGLGRTFMDFLEIPLGRH